MQGHAVGVGGLGSAGQMASSNGVKYLAQRIGLLQPQLTSNYNSLLLLTL